MNRVPWRRFGRPALIATILLAMLAMANFVLWGIGHILSGDCSKSDPGIVLSALPYEQFPAELVSEFPGRRIFALKFDIDNYAPAPGTVSLSNIMLVDDVGTTSGVLSARSRRLVDKPGDRLGDLVAVGPAPASAGPEADACYQPHASTTTTLLFELQAGRRPVKVTATSASGTTLRANLRPGFWQRLREVQ